MPPGPKLIYVAVLALQMDLATTSKRNQKRNPMRNPEMTLRPQKRILKTLGSQKQMKY